MALPGSGALSFSAIQTEFGGSNPISLSEYYRGGAYVRGQASTVPTSGAISLSNFYGTSATIVLAITSNTSHVNILTLATAAGYNAASDTTPIIVNVSAGISGSSAPALRTGALNAASNLTINIASGASIEGFAGAVGGTGAAGGTGGDGILFEITSGTGTYLVDNDGTTSGGGGGGGGGGSAGASWLLYYDGKGDVCSGPVYYGSNGSNGATGALGAAGAAGTAGGYRVGACNVTVTAGAGGAGGAAGKAVNFGGLSVSTAGSAGTFNGATS